MCSTFGASGYIGSSNGTTSSFVYKGCKLRVETVGALNISSNDFLYYFYLVGTYLDIAQEVVLNTKVNIMS